MKSQLYKAAILATIGLASVSAVKAESYGDLIVGFTTQSGTDHMYDLGALSTLTSGETWSAATLGITGGSFYWGVIGDATAADSSFLTGISSTADTLWLTTGGVKPAAANGSTVSSADTGINGVLVNFGGSTASYSAGSTATDLASDDNSWNQQTIVGPHATSFVNSYANPNVQNQATASLWQVTGDSSSPVLDGTFNLGTDGTLTFNTVAVPEPATYGLLAASGLLVVSLRNQFRRKQA